MVIWILSLDKVELVIEGLPYFVAFRLKLPYLVGLEYLMGFYIDLVDRFNILLFEGVLAFDNYILDPHERVGGISQLRHVKTTASIENKRFIGVTVKLQLK